MFGCVIIFIIAQIFRWHDTATPTCNKHHHTHHLNSYSTCETLYYGANAKKQHTAIMCWNVLFCIPCNKYHVLSKHGTPFEARKKWNNRHLSSVISRIKDGCLFFVVHAQHNCFWKHEVINTDRHSVWGYSVYVYQMNRFRFWRLDVPLNVLRWYLSPSFNMPLTEITPISRPQFTL